VSCNVPGVPNDATNLAARAASALLDDGGVAADVAIAITKRIPPGAGLGGGSSNAASVLRVLDTMLELRTPQRRLADLALGLGADVPFFLTGGCARVRGIGEEVEPIAGWPGRSLVVALPPVAVATAWAFRAYALERERRPTESRDAASRGDDPERLGASRDIDPALLWNDLESVVLPAHPEVARAKRGLIDAGASAAVMSGSGAAVIGLVPPGTRARALATAFAVRHPEIPVHCARILAANAV
jgi:4-diphosphocytidyl-2-C-methyl-D-erythritol kinase